MKKEQLSEKLLSIFGYTRKELNVLEHSEGLDLVFVNEAESSPTSFLEMFLLRISDEEFKELQQIVFE